MSCFVWRWCFHKGGRHTGVHDDAVGDLLAGCGVCCRPGAAWDLRRCFVFRPLASYFLGLSPLTPAFVLFVGSCVGVGFLAGCLPVFLWFFMAGAGRFWRIVLGCVVTCWGGENARGR